MLTTLQTTHLKNRKHSTLGSSLRVNSVSNKSERYNMNLMILIDGKLMNVLLKDKYYSTLGSPLQEVNDSNGRKKKISMLFCHEMT